MVLGGFIITVLVIYALAGYEPKEMKLGMPSLEDYIEMDPRPGIPDY